MDRIDWLGLERDIRFALHQYYQGTMQAGVALDRIDRLIGSTTERGYESDIAKGIE